MKHQPIKIGINILRVTRIAAAISFIYNFILLAALSIIVLTTHRYDQLIGFSITLVQVFVAMMAIGISTAAIKKQQRK